MTAVDLTAVVLWLGVTAYAVFGGADFGGGFWDLVAGGAERGRRAADPDRRRDRAGLGGEPHLADLRPGDPVDGVPGRVRGDHVDPVRAAQPGGLRDRPARRRLRLPAGRRGPRRAARRRAPCSRRHRSSRRSSSGPRPGRSPAAGSRSATRPGDLVGELAEPDVAAGGAAGGRDVRLPGRRLPGRRRAAARAARPRRVLPAAGDARPRSSPAVWPSPGSASSGSTRRSSPTSWPGAGWPLVVASGVLRDGGARARSRRGAPRGTRVLAVGGGRRRRLGLGRRPVPGHPARRAVAGRRRGAGRRAGGAARRLRRRGAR